MFRNMLLVCIRIVKNSSITRSIIDFNYQNFFDVWVYAGVEMAKTIIRFTYYDLHKYLKLKT